MSLRYNLSSAQARALLLKSYNDIDIFIEDASRKYAVETVVKNSLEPAFKPVSIIALGSKADVINASLNPNPNRKQLYIVDGDTELMLERFNANENVYMFRKYCIENYYINTDDFAKACMPFNLNSTVNDIKTKIDIEHVFKNASMLVPLYLLYAISLKHNLDMQTISYNIHRMKKDTSGVISLCEYKIRERCFCVAREIIDEIGVQSFLSLYRRAKLKLKESKLTALDIISGKEVLVKLCHNFAKHKLNFTSSEDVFFGMLVTGSAVNDNDLRSKALSLFD